MNETRLPGWYEDPSGASDRFRYWDGERWTDMERSADLPANEGGVPGAMPSGTGRISFLKLLSKYISEFSKLSVALTVVLAVAVCLFGQGGFEIFGTGLSIWLERALRATTMIMILVCLVGNPADHASQKKDLRAMAAARSLFSVADSREPGEDLTDASAEALKMIMSFSMKYFNTLKNCDIASSILAAAAALALLLALVPTVGYPWADIATILFTLLFTPLLSTVISAFFTARLRAKHPYVSNELVETLDGDLRSVARGM